MLRVDVVSPLTGFELTSYLAVHGAAEASQQLVVVFDAAYAGPAAAMALDWGWDSVEIAPENNTPRPPLVSYDQKPPSAGLRCRLRCTQSVHSLSQAANLDSTVVLGSLLNLRPMASRIATFSELTHLLIIANGVGDHDRVGVGADSWWGAGALIRVLLDEIDGRALDLSDSAGIAVSLAADFSSAEAAIRGSMRYRQVSDAAIADDNVERAIAFDSVGDIPVLAENNSSVSDLILSAW